MLSCVSVRNAGHLYFGYGLFINLIALLSEGDLSQNVLIRPGDTVYVASGTGQKYYVLGQVKKPGPYEWTKEITVLEAIKLADGGTETAALNRIIIRKHVGGSDEELRVNVVDIMKGKKVEPVAGLVLAAGASTRMGTPKQLLPVGTELLLEFL